MINLGYVIVSKYIIEGKLPVKFMYREQPDNEQDSGWRFFAGIEEQEYVDDPQNMVICDINTVLSIDKSILPYLNSTTRIAFEREKDTEPFKIVPKFPFTTETGDK